MRTRGFLRVVRDTYLRHQSTTRWLTSLNVPSPPFVPFELTFSLSNVPHVWAACDIITSWLVSECVWSLRRHSDIKIHSWWGLNLQPHVNKMSCSTLLGPFQGIQRQSLTRQSSILVSFHLVSLIFIPVFVLLCRSQLLKFHTLSPVIHASSESAVSVSVTIAPMFELELPVPTS